MKLQLGAAYSDREIRGENSSFWPTHLFNESLLLLKKKEKKKKPSTSFLHFNGRGPIGRYKVIFSELKFQWILLLYFPNLVKVSICQGSEQNYLLLINHQANWHVWRCYQKQSEFCLTCCLTQSFLGFSIRWYLCEYSGYYNLNSW